MSCGMTLSSRLPSELAALVRTAGDQLARHLSSSGVLLESSHVSLFQKLKPSSRASVSAIFLSDKAGTQDGFLPVMYRLLSPRAYASR